MSNGSAHGQDNAGQLDGGEQIRAGDTGLRWTYQQRGEQKLKYPYQLYVQAMRLWIILLVDSDGKLAGIPIPVANQL